MIQAQKADSPFEKQAADAFKAASKIEFAFCRLNQIQSHFISHLACGKHHALLLTSSGFVYSFGQAEYGQLGHSKDEDLKEPTIIL